VVSERAAVLETHGISKAFGHVQALREVSFELYPAEVVALVGDNGAGKSTLIKILAGVHHADEGELRLDGQPVEIRTPSEAVASGIATVYQDLALVDTLDVARNIYLGGVPKRFGILIDYPKMYADASGVLGSLAITLGSVRTKVANLSGGQRQAVAIARALAHEARVVLMDEPTAALGVEQQSKVNDLITNLRGQGKTVVVISHNLEHLFRVADRFLVLRHGRCVADRPVDHTSREEIVGLITGAIDRVEASDPEPRAPV
jgi:ABC-type sugar transport system ATPase subunit